MLIFHSSFVDVGEDRVKMYLYLDDWCEIIFSDA